MCVCVNICLRIKSDIINGLKTVESEEERKILRCLLAVTRMERLSAEQIEESLEKVWRSGIEMFLRTHVSDVENKTLSL